MLSCWCVRLQETTNSPILWEAEFRDLQLAGSPTLALAREREAAIRQEWEGVTASMAETDSEALKDERYNERAFLQAFAVVLAHAIYLPSAQCFALLPYVSFMQRTGNDNGCTVDYDLGASLSARVRADDLLHRLLDCARPLGAGDGMVLVQRPQVHHAVVGAPQATVAWHHAGQL